MSTKQLSAENFSSNGNTNSKEMTLQDKAMSGTVTATDFKSFIVDFIRAQNTENLKSTECSLSKSQLDWNLKGNLIPVADFSDMQTSVNDSLKIFNNSKSKKVYFIIDVQPNPKFSLTVNPEYGEIRKGANTEVNFKLRAFCTTKVYQMFKISFSHSKPKVTGTVRSFPKKKATGPSEEIGHLFASFKVESELSPSIDFDEIKMGEKIAKGGFGTVYKGEWRTTEVAIKMLNTQEMVDEEKELVKREIKLMSRLNYSYIVTYMGSTQIVGQPLCIVMEFVKGGSLSDFVKRDSLSERFKCKLALDVAKGMAFLHSHNIYHRDLKPDNMLVVSTHADAYVNLKITDFGTSRASTFSAKKIMDPAYQAFNDLSKQTPEKQKEERKMTKGIGTLIYQAPEIINGETDSPIDKTDIYSMAILLLEVFTQKEPYAEAPYDKFSKWDIEKFVGSGQRITIPDAIHPRIKELITQCWDQKPLKRPDFTHIVKVLNEVMESLPMDNTGPARVGGSAEKLERNSSRELSKPSPSSANLNPNNSNNNNNTNGAKQDNKAVPIPKGNLNLIGWVGDLDRKDCESKLKGTAAGTFLLRWSHTTSSYVLTYQNKTGPQHIAYIIPDLKTGEISVDKEDGKRAQYNNIFEYINAMKDSGIISQPIQTEETKQEDVYGRTPSLQTGGKTKN